MIMHFPNKCLFIDYFVNPWPALAVWGMALNDHWFKHAYPSWLTGKISDFLGVFYFPLLICALVCLMRNFVIRPFARRKEIAYITPRLMKFAMAITAFLMIAIKASPWGAHEVETIFSELFFRIRITPDPTDLVALASLYLSYRYAKIFFPFISDLQPALPLKQ